MALLLPMLPTATAAMVMATVDTAMVATVTDMAAIITARGRPKLSPAMAMVDMVDMVATDTAMDMAGMVGMDMEATTTVNDQLMPSLLLLLSRLPMLRP